MGNIENVFESIVFILQALFGFLPSWCLVLLGSAFVLILAILAYKLIRG